MALTDYIFATFLGHGGIPQQKVCFSVSRDGNHWVDMNGNQPILSVADATEGDKGVRDPFLFRTPEGDKFYLIATDLCIGSGEGTHDWGTAQSKTESSKYIRVWESYDFVNWSEPWLAEIGVSNSNFTWAPEAIWDEKSGQYMVYWAVGGSTTEEYPNKTSRTYYCMTRDFHTFTQPKIFSENMTNPMNGQIDTSILYLGDNTYVRTSSSSPDIPIEISTNGLFGDWERITNLQALGLGCGAGGNTTPGLTIVEGPELFAYNEDDWIVENGVAVPTWGTIMPITAEEYEAFVEAYGGEVAGSIATNVTVGTMPEVSTGLDDHTAVWSLLEDDTVTSYIKKYTLNQETGEQTATDLTQVPVTFELSAPYGNVQITVDGASCTNGSAVDLTQARTFGLRSGNTIQTITVEVPQLATNAVLPGQLSDPDIDYFDGKYWLFPTTDGFGGWSGTQFHAFSSDSLEGPWKDEGVILETNKDAATATNTVHGYEVPKCTWSMGSAWAPSIEKIGERYYFFYCAKLPDGNSCIGVAVADDPTGPYVPQDEPLVQRGQGGITVGQAIDPSAFTDEDGTHYLYYGNGNPAVAEFTVSEDGTVEMVEDTFTLLEGLNGFRESVTVNKIGDTYHFLWSVDDTESPNYSVYYGTSDNPYGPVEYHYPLCQKDESMGILGTAHQSTIVVDGAMYMAYHRFYTLLNFYTDGLGYHRETCINQVPIGDNGLLLPFVPTVEGVSGDVILRDGSVWNPESGEDVEVPDALYDEDFNDAAYHEGTNLMDGAKVEDGVLVLDGNKAYLSLPDGLLNGTDQATQDEANTAWENLLEAIWSLGLKQGDKAMLNLLVKRANAMMGESEKYVETNWQQLVDALTAAQNVASDSNAMQEDVDEAAEALLNAILAQRYKADKSILEALLTQAETVDISGASSEAVAVFYSALANAKAVMANDDLSADDQKSVDNAVAALNCAIGGLAAGGAPEMTDTPEHTNQPEGADKPQTTPAPDQNEVPATGDQSELLMSVAILVCAVAGMGWLTVCRRKEER